MAIKLPIPPEDLRWRVVGNRDENAFINSGPPAIAYFNKLLTMVSGQGLDCLNSILDWGCGCGRLIRALPDYTTASLFGCDIDKEAIDWCASNLPIASFFNSGELPPLPFDDNTFDLVYATSVLTHLDEPHQNAWLTELVRVIKPNGYAILTYKGFDHFKSIKDRKYYDDITQQLLSEGIIFTKAPVWKDVFPDYYQDTYHSYQYILKQWGRYFEVLTVNPPQILQQYSVLLQNTKDGLNN